MTKLAKAFPYLTGSVTAACLAFSTGCSGVAQNKTTKTATQGAVAGAIAGAVIGNNRGSGNAPSGAVVGGALGAATGAIVGAIGDAKERNEQDRLAQERAYQQELAKRRAQEAKFRAAIDEELAVAAGYRITDAELEAETERATELEAQLKRLQEERQAALNKKNQLDTAQNRIAAAQAEIERLSAELAELRGESVTDSADSYVEHRVEQGENITSIASRYKVPESKIRDANANIDLDNLTPGQMILIPISGVSASAL